MKFRYAAVFILISVIAVVSCSRQKGKAGARAELYGQNGESMGVVLFKENSEGVKITAKLHGLKPGMHGFHIHENGECEPPDFKSAGGHFNPYNKEHGFLNKDGSHAGDLPNIQADADGRAEAVFTSSKITLKKGKRNSILGKNTCSVVIHDGADDYITEPAGDAGKRAACGIIKEMHYKKRDKKQAEQIEERLDDIKKRLKEAENKFNELSDKDRAMFTEAMTEIKRQYSKIEESADEIIQEGSDTASELAEDFERNAAELERRVQRAIEELQSKYSR